MTFEPGNRRLYSDALRPPAGYVFDRALATTFTLDLTALLSIPLHLTLFARDQDTETLLDESVSLLEALRRTTERVQVYCHQGRIGVPRGQHVLFSLLESVVIEARAPRQGFFHPKLWVLRFVPREGDGPRLRLLVLSRNLTRDHAWDLMLAMDGSPGRRKPKNNRPLSNLISRLPDLAAPGSKEPDRELAALLAEEVARTEWELPDGFEELAFHVLGLDRDGWRPPESQQFLVFSPYVEVEALKALTATGSRAVALVARAEELDRVDEEALAPFQQVYHLDPIAIQGEGDVTADFLSPQAGFHAKAFVFRQKTRTLVVMGSANATGAAFRGANVELLVELVGHRKRVGEPETLLADSGLLRILQPYVRSEPIDDLERKAAAALDRAREDLIALGFTVRCEQRGDSWWLVLLTREPLPGPKEFPEVAVVRVWPITIHPEMGQDLLLVRPGEEIAFSTSVSRLTGFFAFQVKAKQFDLELRFVLNLPVTGMPDARYSAIMHSVIQNRERFIRYLLLLLGTGEEGWPSSTGEGSGSAAYKGAGWDDAPLLEEMVRALCRDPERLRTVGAILRRLKQEKGAEDLIPEGLLTLWETMHAVLGENK